jgi:hypothetical protein
MRGGKQYWPQLVHLLATLELERPCLQPVTVVVDVFDHPEELFGLAELRPMNAESV